MSIPTTSRPIDHLGAMAPVVAADAGFLTLGFVEAAIFHVKTRRGMDEVKSNGNRLLERYPGASMVRLKFSVIMTKKCIVKALQIR